MQALSLKENAEQFSRHAAAFLGFSIPLSVALDNVLLALIALAWLAGGDFRRKFATIAANPAAISALALFGLLAAGLAWGSRYPGHGLSYLLKYIDLLFIPILVTVFRDAHTRERALRWFCAGMVVSFVVAELAASGMLAGNALLNRGAGFAVKHSITHGLLSAFAAFVFALACARESRRPLQLLYGVLALVAVKNVAIIGISRTGYLVLTLLALYFFFAHFGRRGLLAAALAGALSFAALYGASEQFRERVDTVVVDQGNWRSKWTSRESVTVRIEWYRASLEVVRDHPVLGAGTGAFPRALTERAEGRKINAPNPHNEYLVIAMQIGLAGLALLVHLWWQQLRLAARLATPVETHLARGLVIAIATGCLFNSFLLDHTEGLLYAWFSGLLFAGLRPESVVKNT
jgi:O-antigen ligase